MWIDKFLEYLEVERRYSALTVKAYENDLLQFADFLQGSEIHQVDAKDIRTFLSYLMTEGMESNSINRKISALKSFYKFLFELEVIQQLPTAGIKNLKTASQVIIPFSELEMEKLCYYIDDKKSDFENTRDKLIIDLLYFTGMRRAELINLQWSQVDLDNLEIKIFGKGGKERLVPMHSKLLESFKIYKTYIQDKCENPIDHVFVTHKCKKLYPKLVYNIVKSYLSIVSEKTKKSPHMIRHSFATHMLNNGAEINAIKELLGHSSLASTQIYTHSDITALKKVFNSNHPRNQNNKL